MGARYIGIKVTWGTVIEGLIIPALFISGITLCGAHYTGISHTAGLVVPGFVTSGSLHRGSDPHISLCYFRRPENNVRYPRSGRLCDQRVMTWFHCVICVP